MKAEEVLDRINQGRKARGEAELSLDSLTSEERVEVFKIAQDLEIKELTIEDLKEHIVAMRKIVVGKLTDEKMERFSLWSFMFNWKKDYELKARLRVYSLLEDLLISPEIIRKHAEQKLGASTGR